jgi:hypothetical protein
MEAVSGHRAQALALLDELSRRAKTSYVSPARIAQIHLGLGERDQALALLDQAVEQHCTEVVWLGVHPMFDELGSEPRFLTLLQRIGLARPESSIATIASQRRAPTTPARP